MKPIEVIIPVPSERVQFSKELYDKNPTGWKVEDRRGLPVRILATDLIDEPIASVDHTGDILRHKSDGTFNSPKTSSNLDLFMRPVDSGVSKDKWMNVYSNSGHQSAERANRFADGNRIALLHIKFVSE